MAIQLSAKAKVLLGKRTLEPNLILEIDGSPYIYGAIDILELDFFDDAGLFFDDGHVFDGSSVSESSKSIISLNGSSNNLTQQLLQDKGGASSVTNLTIDLVDIDNHATELISPNLILDDIMGTKARVYINYAGGLHPQDSVMVHRGIISNVESKAGIISLTVDSPERMKHQDIYLKGSDKLSAGIDAIVTTIPTVNTEQFFLPADAGSLRCFIQIEDEIIEYTGLTANSFTGCVRGSLGTTAIAHSIDSEVGSIYKLSGEAIDLALKLMLSGEDQIFATESVKQFYKVSPTLNRPGAVFFSHYDIQDKLGLVVGDLISTSGAANPANNITDEPILRFDKNEYGSWIETGAAVVLETTTTAIASFKSKYNVLSDGAGMTPQDVDVARHEEMQVRYSSSIPDYQFYLKDSVTPASFLASQIYWPANFYALPRKSKASIGITVPPIADQEIVVLDEKTVLKPSELKSSRSINKYFYNSVVYKYSKNPIDDKYLSGKVFYSADSFSRIKNQGNKALTIASDGMTDSAGTQSLIRTNSRRLLERYQFASESYKGVKVLGKAGVTLEVGDVTIFGSEAFQLSNIDSGDRKMQPKLYEVVNKSLNVKDQSVSVDLLSTNFQLGSRYGIIAPASKVGVGSTTTSVVLVDSFSTTYPSIERDKWKNYVGEYVLIHSQDWTYSHKVKFTGFNPANDYEMLLDSALPSAPLAGYVVDMPQYDNASATSDAKWKMIHCCLDPSLDVVSGISTTQFTVSPADALKFVLNNKIRIHNADYSIDSGDLTVSDITGTTITVSDNIGFVPASGQVVELISFTDGGYAYRWI